MVHVDSGIVFRYKNGEILLLVTWVDLEGIMLNEISKTEKNKNYMISLICGRNIKQKKERNKTKHKQTHRYRPK